MSADRTDIHVYAHWHGMPDPKRIGILSALKGKGRKSFSFEYDPDWIKSKEQFLLDPEISWFPGPQYPGRSDNFGVFMDSMPDTWGRTLMQRRAAIVASDNKKNTPILHDIDYLLGVYDESRMGALRYKLNPEGPFLDYSTEFPTPPWSSVRELQHASRVIESSDDTEEIKKWLSILLAPGTSLGGARPKANVLDENGHLWIAKFPSKNDVVDKGAWEFLAYRLAIDAGIKMAESNIELISGRHHTFFTKRFDRKNGDRIHFASAMTMTGNSEALIRDNTPSYLDISEFIQYNGSEIEEDLHQLWRRVVFNISISNTDDHLRNHGFILGKNGWALSPAFDINPSIDKSGLALNIDTHNNSLDFELAKSIGEYFHLSPLNMDKTINEVLTSVLAWENVAKDIGIPRSEIELMKPAFNSAWSTKQGSY